ncbi:MAG: hypothetical protein Q8O88_01475 [bacterium]|nr:hypothetical protein [bacterium]
MTNIIIRAGSTALNCAQQAQAAISAGDYVSDLRLYRQQEAADLGTLPLVLTFVKNNGHFDGFAVKDKITFTSATGSLTQIQTDIASGVDEDVVGLAVVQVGSPTTGSPTYHAIKASRSFASA